MRFGINIDGIRIRPHYSGQVAKCALCDGILIGNCGEIYTYHFKHKADRNCDSWQEHETDWHREWKAQFPEAWQEVIIENDYEKHIADVKTVNGRVIEFQHSSISSRDIKIRETFYEYMIWVVDAISFADNFILRSVVSKHLRFIESDYTQQLRNLEDNFKDELTTLSHAMEQTEKEERTEFNNIVGKKEKINLLRDYQVNVSECATTIISYWIMSSFSMQKHFYDLAREIPEEFREFFSSYNGKKNLLNNEKRQLDEKVERIRKLEKMIINGREFSKVEYKDLSEKDYSITCAVKRKSRESFFPEIFAITSEISFHSYRYKLAEFDFFYDTTDLLNLLKLRIKEIVNDINGLEEQRTNKINLLIPALAEVIASTISKLEQELNVCIANWDEQILKRTNQILYKERFILENEKDIEDVKKSALLKRNTLRSKAMNEKKGLYSCSWKHERTTWRFACQPIYFDIGKEYLFQKVKEGLFRKIEKKEFLKNYRGY